MRRTLLVSLGFCLVLTAPGCALFRDVPSDMTLRLLPRPDLNPNDLGEPTPLDVRIYQLSDTRLFTQASFEELWTDDKKLLAEELLEPIKVVNLKPGRELDPPSAHDLALNEKVKYLGLLGLFSAPKKEGLEERKLIVPIHEVETKTFVFTQHKIVAEDRKEDADEPKDEEEPKEEATDEEPKDEGEATDEPKDEGASSEGEKPADGEEKPSEDGGEK
ncbi:MAG: type VI secretion system lipoprotein TssJ [Planctomycetota bacterium]